MGFFGPKKSKLEEVAKYMESGPQHFFKTHAGKMGDFALLLNDPEASAALFKQTSETGIKDMEFWVSKIRTATSAEEADFILGQHTQVLNRAWLLMMIEALNARINEQRQFMLTFMDDRTARSEQKLAELRKQMEARQLTPDERKVVQAVLKGFGNEWEAIKRKLGLDVE